MKFRVVFEYVVVWPGSGCLTDPSLRGRMQHAGCHDRAGEMIEAEVPHHVAFTKPERIFVEFYRKLGGDVV